VNISYQVTPITISTGFTYLRPHCGYIPLLIYSIKSELNDATGQVLRLYTLI